jgi:hypothetical protein
MLIDFQQALSDITASPSLCQAIRDNPEEVDSRYLLSPRERRQLLAVARHPGMDCACGIYRMNRLAPLVYNIRETLYGLGACLEAVLVAYWEAHPWALSNGFLEADRFLRWLQHNPDQWEVRASEVEPIFAADTQHLSQLLQEVLSQRFY